MKSLSAAAFERNYQTHLQHLKLKGMQPKTIDAYARAIRRIGKRFDYQIESLSEQQLTDSFTELVASQSWSAVKLDLYGLKFYYAHVLRKPWMAPGLIKPPKARHPPDIVAVYETQFIFAAIRATGWSIANPLVPAGRLLSILAAISIAVSFARQISSLARTTR